MVKRIHVEYHLEAPESQHDTAERVHGIHAEHCPVARTIEDCVDITTSLVFEPV